MAITFIGTPTTYNGDFGSDVLPAKPTGATAGDLAVCVTAHLDNTITVADNNGSTPFTEIGEFDTTHGTLTVYTRRLTGNEGSSFAWTFSSATSRACILWVMRGVDNDDTFDIDPAAGETGSDSSPTCAGVTTTIPNTIAFAVGAIHEFDTAKTFTATPGGWTTLASVTTDQSMRVAYKEMAAAGATGDATFTISANANTGTLTIFAVSPEVPPTPPIGAFDADLVPNAWMDPTQPNSARGWFNWGLPFSHDLLSKLQNYTLVIDSGSYTITGATAGLLATRKIVIDGGTYTLTGSDATLRFGRSMVAEGGSYTLTGSAVTLLFHHLISAVAGSYSITGTAANLEYGRVFSLDSGTYTLTGSAAATLYKRLLAAGGGSYSTTGTAANLKYGRLFAAESGTYTLTGSAAATLYKRLLAAGGGSYTLTGASATLTVSTGITPWPIPTPGLVVRPTLALVVRVSDHYNKPLAVLAAPISLRLRSRT